MNNKNVNADGAAPIPGFAQCSVGLLVGDDIWHEVHRAYMEIMWRIEKTGVRIGIAETSSFRFTAVREGLYRVTGTYGPWAFGISDPFKVAEGQSVIVRDGGVSDDAEG